MADGVRIFTIPRHNPVNAFTMGGIARDAGLTVEEFKNTMNDEKWIVSDKDHLGGNTGISVSCAR